METPPGTPPPGDPETEEFYVGVDTSPRFVLGMSPRSPWTGVPPPVSPETKEFYGSVGIVTSTRPSYDLRMLPFTPSSPWTGVPPHPQSVAAAMLRQYPELFSQECGLKITLLRLRQQHCAAAHRAADPAAGAPAGYREHARAEVERFRALGHANPLLAYHVDCSIKLEKHSIQIHLDSELLSKKFCIDEAEYRRRLECRAFAADYYQLLPQ